MPLISCAMPVILLYLRWNITKLLRHFCRNNVSISKPPTVSHFNSKQMTLVSRETPDSDNDATCAELKADEGWKSSMTNNSRPISISSEPEKRWVDVVSGNNLFWRGECAENVKNVKLKLQYHWWWHMWPVTFTAPTSYDRMHSKWEDWTTCQRE